MATATYTTSFSSELAFSSHPVGTLSGPSASIPSNAIITSIRFSVYCGVSTYNYDADCNMTLTDSSGGSLTISDTFNTGDSNRVWAEFGGSPSGSLDWNNLSTIQLSGTNKLVTRTGYTATLTITYVSYSTCGAPSQVSVSAESAAPGAKVTLSWSGASAGENNAITGYQIYRSTSSSDGPYTLLNTVSSTATSGSTTVTAPTTDGATYYYKVLTVGAVSGYNSGQSSVYATLTCAFAGVTAPTTVKLVSTNASPGAGVTLSWSGATAGTNNPITGYRIYRADESEVYTLLETVSTSATSGSVTVYAPTTNLASYYYRVATLGTLSGYDSELSSASATLTCNYAAPSAPSEVTANGEALTYALPGASVTLKWSGAVDGVNNPITGYAIYRGSVLLTDSIPASASSYVVTSHETAGNAYTFRVVALGAYANSAQSDAVTIYSYTDPVAPTAIAVSSTEPAAGERVSLSWSGAQAGGYNSITGYRIYRSSSATGTYARIGEVTSTAAAASCFVNAPPNVGESYYFKVEAVGEYSTSGLSSAYVELTTASASSSDDGAFDAIIKPDPQRARRGLLLGDYDTAADDWTLCELEFSEPETQTNYVEVPGRAAGPLDLSTQLTDGDPRYNSRKLTARLECSEGTRPHRLALISIMVNQLHGRRVDIVLPDDQTRYVTGRLHLQLEYCDEAHASISISAECEPWRYNKQLTCFEISAVDNTAEFVLWNNGRRVMIPDVKVSGYNARVYLTCGEKSWTLTAGAYRLPDLLLWRGATKLACSGSGNIQFTYREAIL